MDYKISCHPYSFIIYKGNDRFYQVNCSKKAISSSKYLGSMKLAQLHCESCLTNLHLTRKALFLNVPSKSVQKCGKCTKYLFLAKKYT